MGGVGLSLVGLFLVVRSFKISKALTFTISILLAIARQNILLKDSSFEIEYRLSQTTTAQC